MFAHDKKTSVRPAVQGKPNRTGLPDRLKSGVESLSGVSLDSIRVHYNSPEPAQLQAWAYARGTEIHIASGQEQHLPHEAWHAAQQLQGRVPPTTRSMGAAVNDDPALEREADIMGRRAAQYQGGARSGISPGAAGRAVPSVAQLAKYGPLDPNVDCFSADDFGSYFPDISSIKESSWNILKRICFSRLRTERCRAPGATEVRTSTIGMDSAVTQIVEQIKEDFPRLRDLFQLYRELAQVKFAGELPRGGAKAHRAATPRNQWKLPDGSLTESAEIFLECYRDAFKDSELVTRYKSAIANELKIGVYSGSSETPLYHYGGAYHLSPQSAQPPGQDAGKNIVLYRAMRPVEYTYLKEYIDHFKSKVDAIYDDTTVGNTPAMGDEKSPIKKINDIYNEFTGKFRGHTGTILPIGAHIGDFEQVTSGYMDRDGADERVVVKFVMRKQGEGKLGSFIQHLTQPVNGNEGPPDIIERDHRSDKIGAKWEQAPRFSLNVGTSKWASFMFMYFVDKIEVLNPGAMK